MKQEVYRLKNQKEELESDLKRERDNSKRLDPQLMSQLVARHQRELSEVKQKQWVSHFILAILSWGTHESLFPCSASHVTLKRHTFAASTPITVHPSVNTSTGLLAISTNVVEIAVAIRIPATAHLYSQPSKWLLIKVRRHLSFQEVPPPL